MPLVIFPIVRTPKWREDMEKVRAICVKKKRTPEMGSEPDSYHFSDHGYDCACVRNQSGAWCGYVRIPPGHPWFAKSYEDIKAQAHGGLAFSSLVKDEETGETHFWVGFHCGHLELDFVPMFLGTSGDYRTWGFALGETRKLARQAAEAQKARDDEMMAELGDPEAGCNCGENCDRSHDQGVRA